MTGFIRWYIGWAPEYRHDGGHLARWWVTLIVAYPPAFVIHWLVYGKLVFV